MKKIKFIVLGVLTLCLSLIGVAQVSAAEEVESEEQEVQFAISVCTDSEDGNGYTLDLTSPYVSGIFLNDVSNTIYDLKYGYDEDNQYIELYDIKEVLIELYLDDVDISKATLVFDFDSEIGAPELMIKLKEFVVFDEYGVHMLDEIILWIEKNGDEISVYEYEKFGDIDAVIYQDAPWVLYLSDINNSYGDDGCSYYLEEMEFSLSKGDEILYEFEVNDYEFNDNKFYVQMNNLLKVLKQNVLSNELGLYSLNIYAKTCAIEGLPVYVFEHAVKLIDCLETDENGNIVLKNIFEVTLDSNTEVDENNCIYSSEVSIRHDNYYDYILFTANEIAEPDTEAPKIYGTNEYTVSTKTQYSIDTIKGALFAEDNSGEEVGIKLFSDYYSENYQTPGTYYVTFFATDNSGNTTTYPVKINVKDTQAPVFYDKNGKEVTSTTVYKSLDSVLLISEVMDKMTVTDDVDGEINTVSIIKDNYTGYGDEAGTYTIVVRAKDAAGNKTDFVIYVYVLDSMPDKTLIIDKHHIVVENNVKLTDDNIAAILKTCGYYKTNTTSYVTINSEAYTELYDTNGEYLVEYNIVTTSGTEIDGVLTVEVVDARAGDNTIVEEEPNIFMKVLNWIWNLIKKIFTFIADLFSGKLFK